MKNKFESFWNLYQQEKNPSQKKLVSKSWASLNYQLESTGITGVRYAISLVKNGIIVQLEIKEKSTAARPELLKKLRQHLLNNFSNICIEFGEDLEVIENETSFALRKTISGYGTFEDEATWKSLIGETLHYLDILKRSTKPFITKNPSPPNPGLLLHSNNPEAFQQNNKQNFCSESQF